MKVAIKTLGCKVNQVESDILATTFSQEGVEVVSFGEEADLYIVNSCAVTKEAENKTRQLVNRILRKHLAPRIILTGCYAYRISRERENPFEESVFLLPDFPKEKEIINLVGKWWGEKFTLAEYPLPSRARAWLKVEDGCDHFCSYCLIPHLRGKIKSEEKEKIIRQAQALEREGIREIVLCGVNLGYYGKDRGEKGLINLLEELVDNTTLVRFRLSSIEPFLLDEEFVKRYFSLRDRVCPHFHLPLQSGSDRVLKSMRRGYDTTRYRALVSLLRSYCPAVAISTDIIVGFPTEEKEDFENTVNFSQEIGFSRTHVFVFSPRPGTPAFLWEKERGTPKKEKKNREKILLQVARETQKKYYHLFLGKKLKVLVESIQDGTSSGYSENYIPVRFRGNSKEREIVEVTIEKEGDGFLEGKL
ncbi:MAG TPA: tRNA (N(6)-L-threonylcarbamoyladenosine(37)-C(2))-methylthiotransferase MtaB [Candidatus Atribacteria bacterium]|nr:tRNA (N(6)-L-threonylcarbamoyladenosine(37)-C(2))-methylthiotransferase MtaB [Candidatus Atribacteria bacterium]